jgi:hypothetical protein
MRNALLRLLVSVSILHLGANVLSAQSKPNFSGTWIRASSGQKLEIRHEGSTFVVKSSIPEQTFTFLLDGSISRNTTTALDGETWTHDSHARWLNNALLITTTTTRANGGYWEWMTTYSFDGNEGGRLSVTTLDGVLAQGPWMSTTTRLYNKADAYQRPKI